VSSSLSVGSIVSPSSTLPTEAVSHADIDELVEKAKGDQSLAAALSSCLEHILGGDRVPPWAQGILDDAGFGAVAGELERNVQFRTDIIKTILSDEQLLENTPSVSLCDFILALAKVPGNEGFAVDLIRDLGRNLKGGTKTFDESRANFPVLADVLTKNEELRNGLWEDFSQDVNFCEEISTRFNFQSTIKQFGESPLLKKYVGPPHCIEIIFAVLENRNGRAPAAIDFSSYVDANGQIDMARIGTHMVGLLLSPGFRGNIGAQKDFIKLYRLFTNEGNILASLGKIAANGICQASALLPSFREKSFSAQVRVQLALDTVFKVPVRQKGGVGSCFASASLIFMQDEDPTKMMELLADILCDGKIKCHRNRGDTVEVPVNLLGGTQGDCARDLHYAIVRTLADACIGQGRIVGGGFTEMSIKAFMADFKIQQFVKECCREEHIHCDVVDNRVQCSAFPFSEMLALGKRLDAYANAFNHVCYIDSFGESIWGASGAQFGNGVNESFGVYVPCIEYDGKFRLVSRDEYDAALVDIRNDMLVLLQKLRKKSMRKGMLQERDMSLLSEIPGEARAVKTEHGGFELQVMRSVYGNAKKTVFLGLVGGVSADVVFCEWLKLVQQAQKDGGQLTRILASGLLHVYTVNFALSQLLFDHINENASYFLNYLQQNSGKVISFIDPNWADGAGAAIEIGIRWNPGGLQTESLRVKKNADGSTAKRKDGTVEMEQATTAGFEFVWKIGGKWISFTGGDFLDKYLATVQ
jgi:hypothetical protein